MEAGGVELFPRLRSPPGGSAVVSGRALPTCRSCGIVPGSPGSGTVHGTRRPVSRNPTRTSPRRTSSPAGTCWTSRLASGEAVACWQAGRRIPRGFDRDPERGEQRVGESIDGLGLQGPQPPPKVLLVECPEQVAQGHGVPRQPAVPGRDEQGPDGPRPLEVGRQRDAEHGGQALQLGGLEDDDGSGKPASDPFGGGRSVSNTSRVVGGILLTRRPPPRGRRSTRPFPLRRRHPPRWREPGLPEESSVRRGGRLKFAATCR